MKKFIVVILMLAVIGVAWVGVLNSSSSKDDNIAYLKQQIESNIEVKTYKNTLPLYTELIEYEPDNIEWYVGLADAYAAIEQYGEYEKQCEVIVDTFPDDAAGYLKLIRYYDEMGEIDDVLSLYINAPENVQVDTELTDIYKKYEWEYRFASGTFNYVTPQTGGTYMIEVNGLYGYISKDLSVFIEPGYVQARPFIEDYAAVNKDDEWYFIDKAGDRVLASKEKIEDLHSFSEGCAVAKINGKYGYIDMAFNKYAFEYEDATSFYNGVAAVKKSGKWGLINNNFENITEFEYDNVIRDDANLCSRKGIIFLRKNQTYNMIGIDGKKVTEEVFDDARLFYSEYAPVKKGDKWGFIDYNGNLVMDYKYEDASSVNAGIAAVKFDEYWGCVGMSGNILLENDYEHTMVTADNGTVAVKSGELYRFIKFIRYE